MLLGRKEMEKLVVLTILANIFGNAFAASIEITKDTEKINPHPNCNRIKMDALHTVSMLIEYHF